MIADGDLVTIDGYSFYKTTHGPLILTSCVDCGKEGILVTIDGYSFYKTTHGPLILTSCVDCGKEGIGTRGRLDDTDPWPPAGWDARCTGCARRHHGLD